MQELLNKYEKRLKEFEQLIDGLSVQLSDNDEALSMGNM